MDSLVDGTRRFLDLFDRPGYLVLVPLLVPLLWIASTRALSGLSWLRRLTAISLRTVVLCLIVVALAELQLTHVSDKVTVFYLLDQSESIPREKRELMRDYAIRAVRDQRNASREDRAGVIVFGREAAIEVPPFEDDLPEAGSFEAFVTRYDATNLEAALKLAQASFPEDGAKRVVIVSDGNENTGDALAVAPTLAGNGIGIDVIPVRLVNRAEVALEKVTLPPNIRQGTPFEVRVVLNNFMDGDPGDSRFVRGRVRLTRSMGGRGELIGEKEVELPPGKTVVGFEHTIDQPAMYTYEAAFAAEDAEDDVMPQNNQASAFTHVRGKGRVLLIEDSDHRGEFDFLIERMRGMNLEIDVQPSNQLFGSLAELQAYDCVVLANVPRSSGDDAASVSSFRDEQIRMLVRNTQQMGAGLVMLGGPRSFGAGGWANTELEEAMPVDFQVRNSKIEAVGALVLLMHASEMAAGNHWQKVVARESIQALGPMDYCGLIHWDNYARDAWLWGGANGLVRVGDQKKQMLALVNRMIPGDMPEFEPSLQMALDAFNRVNASMKHMIVISDGDPGLPLDATLSQFKQASIPITTVAVGTHGPAASTPLQAIAAATGGRYYEVTDPMDLPRIYQREARRVSLPLVKDLDNVAPQIIYPHEILQGIDEPLPPLKGMMLTTVKKNPLVEVAVRSPVPDQPDHATILAAWTYGLGRTAVVTTDAGHRWAPAWAEWKNFDKFYSQLIRWAIRPSSDQGRYTVATDIRDGKARIVISALDARDQYRNLLNMSGAAVGPQLEPFPFSIRQVAAGRYVGEFEVPKSGSYHVTIVPHPGEPPILTGLNVPYSAEFRDRQMNFGLLQNLASLKPRGARAAGALVDVDFDASQMDRILALNTFRHNLPKAVSVRDVWPALLLITACLFLADVFVRRVAVGTDWLLPALRWVRQLLARDRSRHPVEHRLEQLQLKKAEVVRDRDERRAATRFEPQEEPGASPTAPADLAELREAPPPPPRQATDQSKRVARDESETDSYTARLLEAKRKAQRRPEK